MGGLARLLGSGGNPNLGEPQSGTRGCPTWRREVEWGRNPKATRQPALLEKGGDAEEGRMPRQH